LSKSKNETNAQQKINIKESENELFYLYMKISLQTKTDSSTPTIIALFEKQKPETAVLGKSKTELVKLHLRKNSFSGEENEQLNTHLNTSNKIQPIMLYGLGKEKKINDIEARKFAAKIIRAAKTFKSKKLSVIVPKSIQDLLQAFIEGLILGNYNPALYKTGDDKKKLNQEEINNIELQAKSWTTTHQDIVRESQATAEAINYIRNLVNSGPNHMDTKQFVTETKLVSKQNRYKLSNFNHRKLRKLKMGGILAVNKGSAQAAHLLILEHNKKLKEDPIILVGKGIIFDTGGISLKPSSSLHEMQLDMAGAATVLGVFKLLKKLNIQRKVVGIMPITDNAINERAYHPSDIITTHSGKTVEIVNTDAEGRLILADGLSYGIEKYNPKYIIDLATLTGSCMVALGYRTAAIMGNDKNLIDQLIQAGTKTDEALCQLPITDADEKSMKGKLADLTNLDSESRYAGASRAGAFLKNFVGESKWAHIDIAGTAFTKEPKDYESRLGTGFGIRLLIDFLQSL